jgi:hypothetical protein
MCRLSRLAVGKKILANNFLGEIYMIQIKNLVLLSSMFISLIWLPSDVSAGGNRSVRAETKFCSDGGGNHIFVKKVRLNKKKKVCFQVKSKEKEEITVTLRLVDGLENGGRAVCRAKGTNPRTGFSKASFFLANRSQEVSFKIKPNQTVKQYIALKIDKFEHIKHIKKRGVNFDGLIGCVATLGKIAKPVPGKIAIQVRRANTLIAIPGNKVDPDPAVKAAKAAKKKVCRKGDTISKSGTYCFQKSKIYRASVCNDGLRMTKHSRGYCIKDGHTFREASRMRDRKKKKEMMQKPI